VSSATTDAEARALLESAIASGRAAEVMQRMVVAHGGDGRVVENPANLLVAKQSVPVVAERDGVVARVDALQVGLAAVAMGAGRTRADQEVDPAVGISVLAKPGATVVRGQPLALIHVHEPLAAVPIVERVRAAYAVEDGPVSPLPLVLERIGAA
jgi:pyrimidine-nucleoside phosphorylase